MTVIAERPLGLRVDTAPECSAEQPIENNPLMHEDGDARARHEAPAETHALTADQIAQSSLSLRVEAMRLAAETFQTDNTLYAEAFPRECRMVGVWLVECAPHVFNDMLTDDEVRYGV